MLDTAKSSKPLRKARLAAASTTDTPAPKPVPVPDGFNANCKITNTSGADLLVLDGSASSDTASEILYEQNLKILTDSNGASILKNNTSTTYVLNDSYYDDDYKDDENEGWEYSYNYNLIIVRASDLFPVKVVGVMPNLDYTGYDAITVTAGDAKTPGDFKNMQDSQAFQQNLMAYPDSPVATAFVNACSASMDKSGSDKDIDSKVDAFFASTESYKNVTLNSLTAIQTYWETFPFIWAGYAAGKSYYLYTSNGSAVSYVGSLDITAPTTAPASTDKSLAGFTFSFTPADGNAPKKTLKYVNGQFVDSVETTTVALKGLYQLKSQFTNVATDNVIIAYMTGSVNGAKVIGYNEKPKQDSNGNWSGFYSLLHPKDGAGWMALALEIGAVAMTLELFSRPLKYLWDKFRESRAKNKGADPSKADADRMRADAKGKQTRDAAEAQRTMDRMGTDITIKIEISINDSVAKLQVDRANRITEDSRSNLSDITTRQAESVGTISKYERSTDTQKMATEIGKNKTALDPVKTPTEKLAGMLDTVKTTAKNLLESITDAAKRLVNKTTADEKSALDKAQKANDDALKIQDEIEESKSTEDKGDNSDVKPDDIPKPEIEK